MNQLVLNPNKYLLGLFFEDDFTFPVEKGKFLNKVKKEFKNDDLVFINDKLLGDNVLSKKYPEFKIGLSSNKLHYEDNLLGANFLKKCQKIVSLHAKVFNNIDINKIGFIIYFNVEGGENEEFFLRNHFFKNLDDYDKFKQIHLHSNYIKTFDNIDYNFNVKFGQIKNKAVGELDINISNQKGLTLTRKNIVLLFEFIQKYFKEKFYNSYFENYGK